MNILVMTNWQIKHWISGKLENIQKICCPKNTFIGASGKVDASQKEFCFCVYG